MWTRCRFLIAHTSYVEEHAVSRLRRVGGDLVPADVPSAGVVRPALVRDSLQLVVRIGGHVVQEVHEKVESHLCGAPGGTVCVSLADLRNPENVYGKGTPRWQTKH